MSCENILLILQDQLRFDVVDEEWCRTSTFDGLRREGMFFEQAHTPIGICSPARASLFTGLYPHSHGLLNNTHGADAVLRNLPRRIPTVAERLQNAGYYTGYVGKWHVGMDDGPLERGFTDVRLTDSDPEFSHDVWVAEMERNPAAVLSRYRAPAPARAERYPRRPRPLYLAEAVPAETTPAVKVRERAQELLRAVERNQPFFLVVSFVEPHWPHVMPEPYRSMYDPQDLRPWANFADDFTGKPSAHSAAMQRWGVADFSWEDWAPVVASYLGATTFVDAQMGELLATLEETGLASSTTVIATADHGDMNGSHGHFNKGPLMYDEVYRIPLAVRGPAATAGTRNSSLVSLVDLGPTILELTGTDPGELVHGRSLAGILRGDVAEVRDALLCEYHGDEFGLYSQRMLRHGRYKLVYNPNDLRELYDLTADPAELHNLAYEPHLSDVRIELEGMLLDLLHETDDPLAPWAVNTLG